MSVAVLEPDDDGGDEDLDVIPELDIREPARWPCIIAPGVPIPRTTKYFKHAPFPKQHNYLCMAVREMFYGGAAGGAKSDAMLMAALQFADVPGYAALILRRALTDLNLPGALMHRADAWLRDTDAIWHANQKLWEFPGGGMLVFGYAENIRDVRRYMSAEFQFIGIDESTQFEELAYRLLFTRLRRPNEMADLEAAPDGLTLADVPLRMRTASNPGDIGHAWHYVRFIDLASKQPGIWYLPSRLEDNPFIDIAEYEANLRKLYPTEWERMRWGNWETRDPGEIFDRYAVELVEGPFTRDPHVKRVRYWDMAATEVKPGKDPDFTVGFKLAWDKQRGRFRVEHVAHVRKKPSDIEDLMRKTAEADTRDTDIVIEQEPGSEGALFIDHVRRHVLAGFKVNGDKVQEAKPARIRMLEPIVNAGDVSCVRGRWTEEFLTEMDAWPHVVHQDQVDAFAGAHRWLTTPKKRVIA